MCREIWGRDELVIRWNVEKPVSASRGWKIKEGIERGPEEVSDSITARNLAVGHGGKG